MLIEQQLEQLKSFSNCDKRNVACIIVGEDDNIYGAGFNLHENGVCDCATTKTAKHAEIMAIESLKTFNGKLYAYVTHKPCNECESALLNICEGISIVGESPILPGWKEDSTTRPKHYAPVCNDKGECVDSIKFFEQTAKSPDHYSEYLRLTAMKYLYRLWSKEEPLTNAKKAKQFLEWLIANMEKN